MFLGKEVKDFVRLPLSWCILTFENPKYTSKSTLRRSLPNVGQHKHVFFLYRKAVGKERN